VLLTFGALWISLGAVNTITPQALMLMGISAATGLGAVAANSGTDTDFKALVKQLADQGIKTWQDMEDLEQQIVAAAPATALRIALEEKHAALRKLIAPYETKSILADILNDDSGAALHRLQVVFWTVLLGAVFVRGVWQGLAMPEFDSNQLALLTISGGSYVGFKVAEKT
jgi:hypothetical protein